MKTLSKIACVTTVVLTGAGASATQAQDAFPAQPVTIMVPAAAGGPTDTVGRLIAEGMSKALGQNVLVENLGGAGGTLGAARVATAAPDGYTLMLYHIGMATFDSLYEQLPFDPAEAFSSVGLVVDIPLVLTGRNDLPVNGMEELRAYIDETQGDVTIGNSGPGGVSFLCATLLQKAAGNAMISVPYQGTGPAMTDLMGGRIDLLCDQTTGTLNPVNDGQIKAFAATSAERFSLLPDVPTMRESGFDDFEIVAWNALWSPAGTPIEVRQKLAEALQAALAEPRVIERFASLGSNPVAAELATPEALDTRFTQELERWRTVLEGVDRQ